MSIWSYDSDQCRDTRCHRRTWRTFLFAAAMREFSLRNCAEIKISPRDPSTYLPHPDESESCRWQFVNDLVYDAGKWRIGCGRIPMRGEKRNDERDCKKDREREGEWRIRNRGGKDRRVLLTIHLHGDQTNFRAIYTRKAVYWNWQKSDVFSNFA